MKYIELTAQTDPEDINWAINNIMHVIHGILSKYDISNIGVSFPEYSENNLGSIVRIFGNEDNLMRVVDNDGIQTLIKRNMVNMEIDEVPSNATYVQYKRSRIDLLKGNTRNSRYQQKIGYLKGKGVVVDSDIRKEIKDRMRKETPKYPFIGTASKSTGGCKFMLYVKKVVHVEQIPVKMGEYTSYGLSKNGSCVPEF